MPDQVGRWIGDPGAGRRPRSLNASSSSSCPTRRKSERQPLEDMTAIADSNGSRLRGTTLDVSRSIVTGQRRQQTVRDVAAQPGSQVVTAPRR
jgi:hypothetical protein